MQRYEKIIELEKAVDAERVEEKAEAKKNADPVVDDIALEASQSEDA
jgi:hypothetical protein